MFHFISENIPSMSDPKGILKTYRLYKIKYYANNKSAEQFEKILYKDHIFTPIFINKIIDIDDFINKIEIIRNYDYEFGLSYSIIDKIFENPVWLRKCRNNKIVSNDDRDINKMDTNEEQLYKFYLQTGIPRNQYYSDDNLNSFFIFVCRHTTNYEVAEKLANGLHLAESYQLLNINDYRMREIYASSLNIIHFGEAVSSDLINNAGTYEKYFLKLSIKKIFQTTLNDGSTELLEYLYSDKEIIAKYYKMQYNTAIRYESTIIKLANLGLFLPEITFDWILANKTYNIHNLIKLRTKSGNNYYHYFIKYAFENDNAILLMEMIYFAGITVETIQKYICVAPNCLIMLLKICKPELLAFGDYYNDLFRNDNIVSIKLAYRMKIWNDYVDNTFQEA